MGMSKILAVATITLSWSSSVPLIRRVSSTVLRSKGTIKYLLLGIWFNRISKYLSPCFFWRRPESSKSTIVGRISSSASSSVFVTFLLSLVFWRVRVQNSTWVSSRNFILDLGYLTYFSTSKSKTAFLASSRSSSVMFNPFHNPANVLFLVTAFLLVSLRRVLISLSSFSKFSNLVNTGPFIVAKFYTFLKGSVNINL